MELSLLVMSTPVFGEEGGGSYVGVRITTDGAAF